MDKTGVRPGSVVFSKSGRDSGRYYLVVSQEGEFAFIADGKTRKLAKPKKKKLKHLRPRGERAETIGEKLEEGRTVFDSEIYSALRAYNEDNPKNQSEGKGCQKTTS